MLDCDEELVFLVEQLEDGKLEAHSMGACIYTQADNREDLLLALKEAVCCHFDEACSPSRLRLRWVRLVSEELLEF